MNRILTTLAVLASLALATAGAAPAFAAGDDSSDNGIVFMVHGNFEPNPTAPTPAPPAQEAFASTPQDGEIVLHVIPYSVDTQTPTAFEDDTHVHLEGQAPGQALTVDPRAGTSQDQRCVDETTIPGHEGDVSDCLVVSVAAEDVRGWAAIDIVLHGTHAPTGSSVVETYSSPAHVAMHTTMEDGEPGWQTADQLSGYDTPLLVEDIVDPVE